MLSSLNEFIVSSSVEYESIFIGKKERTFSLQIAICMMLVCIVQKLMCSGSPVLFEKDKG